MRFPSIGSRSSLYKLILILCLPALTLVLQQFELLKHWDNQVFDMESSMLPRPAAKDIVIVAIDEYSLQKIGKWPWSRRTHAELIELLTAVQPRAIGLDIIFAEPDQNDPAADQALVNAVRNNGRIILPVLPDVNTDGSLQITSPWPELADSAAQLGHVDTEINNDGVVRNVYLTAGMGGKYWPCFALALLTLDKQIGNSYLKGARILNSESSSDLWQRDFRIELPFPGSAGHFPRISYADVLSDPNLRAGLRGKFILVGITAAGLAQRFTTPSYNNTGLISGVEINANVLDVLLRDISILSLNSTWSLILSGVLVIAPLFGYHFFAPRHALFFSLLFSGLTLSFTTILFRVFHYWYGPMPVLSVLTTGYLLWIWQQLQFFTQSLFNQKQLAKATLHAIAEAVITTNAKGVIVYMNPAAALLTGVSDETAKGSHIDSVVKFVNHEDKNPKDKFEYFFQSLLHDRTIRENVPRYIVSHSGNEYAVQINASPIKEKSNKMTGAVFAFSDITETLQISSKINYLASHDPLTGLANRVLFNQQIEKAIASCHRQENYLAVLFIDLDDFKKVNDGMGHGVGDQLLIEVAARLLANMRQIDTVARWGGDEFVVLIEQLPNEEDISNIISNIFERLSPPYHLEGQTLYVTTSIGISVFPKDGQTAEELLVHADAALFQVKEHGRNNYGFFLNSLNKSTKNRLEMEKELYIALEAGEFEVYYQPQIELKTNRIIGAEALLRWNHPHKGMIPPDIFIPLAEKTGFINQIGDWVLQSVCRQIGEWQKQDSPEICISVNISTRQFLQNNLCGKIIQTLTDNNVHGRFLKCEITESLMIKNIDKVAKILCEIRELGVRVSIDDFGTGFSSLSMLNNFPIDQLKIDKEFIKNLGSDNDSCNIVQSIIMLGHNMNMDVVAEGVEDRKQLNFLSEWDCDHIQGYYFSRPLTSNGMAEFILQDRSAVLISHQ